MATSSASSNFYKSFLRLALPSATQSLFFNLIVIFDVLMVGQLGDAPVAAVGLAGQFFFLLNLTLFGTAGGAAVFAAQYWGGRDLSNLRRVLGLCLSVGLAAAAVFAAVAFLAPAWVMGLYTSDPVVVQLGVSYLRIIAWSYVFTAVTTMFAAIVRSTGNTRLPMVVSVACLSLNIALDYSLIFGKFGLPTMGIAGAATGTMIARILESLILISIIYLRKSPVAAKPRELVNFSLPFISHHLRLIFLVFVNEFLWALGVNVYNAMLARLGTSAYAAYNVTSTFQGLGIFLAMGCATTSSILVGHAVGAGLFEEAFHIAKRILIISTSGTFLIGLVLIAARWPLMDLYQVSATARQDAGNMILIAGLLLWLRSLDAIFIVGVLRAGGDTRYAAFLDVGAIWLAGIPAVALAAFVFHLPVQWVYLAIFCESLTKSVIGMRRFLSRRWLRNVTETPQTEPVAA
jgi:putative MATE family efflux protein